MPGQPLTAEECAETLRVLAANDGNVTQTARLLGLTRSAVQHRVLRAEAHRLQAERVVPTQAEARAMRSEVAQGATIAVDAEQAEREDAPPPVDPVQLRRALKAGRHDLAGLAALCHATQGQVLDAINTLRAEGYAIGESAGRYWLDTSPQASTDRAGGRHEYVSRPDGSFVFGFTSDNHLGSKYSRLDVLSKLFARFAEVGVDRVFNAGNWIDGEATFNKHDLVAHGLDGQCRYLVEQWPRVRGLTTYAVAGDDHEGWYAQREGIDIGRYAEQKFRDSGRDDWVDLGFMEADIALVHAETGVRTRLRVAHPGGGSAYATSYAPQKYIESLDGGEKPAVVLLGHWHKMEVLNIRNVWVIQTGCTQDQTPFGRKKRLDFHVGGGLCRLVQDPETGAITSCTVEMLRYFNRAHYGSGRWSHSDDVTMADRVSA